ncbi:MAG: 2,3-butanediol dehydrogenase [Actinomycetaceae bacterium]|nr:2,3-butanediol dehydrogenase [Actinomycetaceae bacterium]MDY6083105.1 2,3-butanediol dehydrogenase [Actinomycetaceae bacterium]
MKALMYYGKEDVRIEDIQEPQIRPGTVKIKIAYDGICGSDLHLYHDGPGAPAPTADTPHPLSGETLPVVFGHEFSGTVAQIADDVEGYTVGDEVCVEPLLVCGECAACRAGKYNLCEKMGFIGISGGGGGLSEYIVVQSRFVHKTGAMGLEQAAMIEPLSVTVHAVRHSGADKADPGVAVIGGAGPIGLFTAAVLRAYGHTTIVSEVSEVRRNKASETGVADYVVDPSKEDLNAKVREVSEGKGATFAFDAAGIGSVVDQLLDTLAPDGRLEIIAIHTRPYELAIPRLMMQDRSMGASIGYANDHPESIRLVNEGLIDLNPFITSKIKVEDIVEQGYNKLLNDRSEVKILVSMN